MKKIFNLSFIFISLVSCMIFVSCGEDIPWSETFLSTIDADGDNLQHLIKDVFGKPKFSHNGEKIIISNNQGFWTVNSDGTDFKCISDSLIANDNHYSISPNNETLIFFQQGEIYQLNYIDFNVIKLFTFEEESAWYPSYSPDGSKLVFSTTSIGQGDSTIVKMYSMNEDGSNQNLLYQNSSSTFGVIRFPIYSNDMEKIFFVYGGLVSCNSNGTDIELIVSGNLSSCPISNSNEYVVFADYYDIFAYNYQTSVIMNLSNGKNPDISPDGTKVTFCDEDLYVIDIDGTNRTKIANTSNYYQSFSFDGEKIVFLGDKEYNSKRNKNPLEKEKYNEKNLLPFFYVN